MLDVARASERLVDRFDAPAGLVREEARYDGFRRRQAGAPEFYFWSQSRCLVTTAQFRRTPDFAFAAARSRKRGWPVFVRRSGGGTVFHGPGALCVSMFERWPVGEARIDEVYARLCTILRDGLRKLGVATEIGPQPAAPCDGRFNILAGGRKLAGTAARIALDRHGAAVLAHASIQVATDFADGLRAVEAFERDLGRDVSYHPNRTTGLPGDLTCEQVAAAIRSPFHLTGTHR